MRMAAKAAECCFAVICRFAVICSILLSIFIFAVLSSERFQTSLIFLNYLSVLWPPMRLDDPATPYLLPGMPALSDLLYLFGGLERTSTHWLDDGDGPRLGLWLTRPADDCSSASAAGSIVLYCHGNGESRAWAPAVRKVRRLPVRDGILEAIVAGTLHGAATARDGVPPLGRVFGLVGAAPRLFARAPAAADAELGVREAVVVVEAAVVDILVAARGS